MGQEISTLPPTERLDAGFADFDRLPVEAQLAALMASQARAIEAVSAVVPALALAVTAAIARLRGGSGRLVYAGAGCSIRIGVQDGVELVPTFGWPLARLAYLVAGGTEALAASVEGAEDDVAAAEQGVSGLNLGPDDVVIGIAASGQTPYTLRVLELARATGALTIAVTSNPEGAVLKVAEHPLCTESGAEVLAGSTRLAAGTAQKVLLNGFSTAVMTGLGRVLGNQMLCVVASNAKLKARQVRILRSQMDALTEDAAHALLVRCDWDLRRALLCAMGHSDAAVARLLASEQPFAPLLSDPANRP